MSKRVELDEDPLEVADDEPEPPVHRLPPHIIHLIFAFCSVSDLILSVQFVCQRWHDELQTVRAWRHRLLKIKSEVEWCQITQTKSHPPVQSLSFKSVRSNVNTAPEKFITHTFLSLTWLKLHVKNVISVRYLLEVKTLTYVDLRMAWEKNHVHELCELADLPNLFSVIFRNFCLHPDDISSTFLKNCCTLKNFAVTKYEKFENYVEKALKRISHVGGKVGVVPHGIELIYIFGSKPIGRSVIEIVSKMKTVHCIALKPTSLTDLEFKDLIFSEAYKTLITLDLSYSTSISNALVSSIAQLCPHLKNLSLARCDVSDEAFYVILNHLHSLQTLNVHGTNITSKYLSSLPSCLPFMTDLNLLACRGVQRSALSQLTNNMPNLSIVHPRRGYVNGSHVMDRKISFLECRNCL